MERPYKVLVVMMWFLDLSCLLAVFPTRQTGRSYSPSGSGWG